MLAEELKTRRQLEVVGGIAYLMQVTGKIPTTAHAGYFIEKVREKQMLRELIKAATGAVEQAYGFTGTIQELESFVAETCTALAPSGPQNKAEAHTFDGLMQFDTTKDPDSLLGFRYLGRSNGMVIVGPSGLGKSVLSVQIAVLAAIGKCIFGLKVVKPLRVLYVQAEDDTGDIAEAVQGIAKAYSLTIAERELAEQNFRALRWTDVTGERFIGRLLGEFDRQPFDLVIINPLFSFAGCNLVDSMETSHFFRHLLNPFLLRTRCAAIVVHHTKKPSTDPKAAGNEESAAYDPFGSSEITNWARAIISLQVVRGSGNKVCKLIFGKRGARAGLVDNDGNPTMAVQVRHSDSGLCWVPSDCQPPSTPGGKFVDTKWNLKKALKIHNPRKTWAANKRNIATALGCTERAVHDRKLELEAVE